jgi:hypothetical protein
VDEAMIREAAVKMNRGARARRTSAQRTARRSKRGESHSMVSSSRVLQVSDRGLADRDDKSGFSD